MGAAASASSALPLSSGCPALSSRNVLGKGCPSRLGAEAMSTAARRGWATPALGVSHVHCQHPGAASPQGSPDPLVAPLTCPRLPHTLLSLVLGSGLRAAAMLSTLTWE